MEPTLVVFVVCSAVASIVVVYAVFYFNRSQKLLTAASDDFSDKPKAKKGNATRPQKIKKSKTEDAAKIPKLKVRDIDIEKFNSRLSEVTDLEPVFSAFLASHLTDLHSQITTLTASVATAETGKNAVESRIEEHKHARMIAENKCSEMKATVSDLNGKLRKLTTEQNESENKILQAKNKAASVLSSQTRATDECEKLRTKLDRVQNELLESKRDNKSMVFSLVKSEEERRGLLDQVRLVEKELESRKQELLSQIVMLKTKITDLERCKIELTQALENTVLEMRKIEQAKLLETENLASVHDQEKLGLRKEVDRAIGDLDGANILLASLKERLEVLEAGNQEMERLKDKNTELRDRNQKLVERVNEIQTAMQSAPVPESADIPNEESAPLKV